MPGIVSASTCGRITEPAYQMSPEFETRNKNNGSNSKSHYRTRILRYMNTSQTDRQMYKIITDGDWEIWLAGDKIYVCPK